MIDNNNKLPPPKKSLDITDASRVTKDFQSSPINIPPLRDAAAEEETKRNLFKNKISGLIIGVSISFALMGVSFWWGLEIGRKSILQVTEPIPIIRADDKPIKVIPKDPKGLDIPHKDIQVLNNSKNTDEQKVVLLPEPEKPILSLENNKTKLENDTNSNLLNKDNLKTNNLERNKKNLDNNQTKDIKEISNTKEKKTVNDFKISSEVSTNYDSSTIQGIKKKEAKKSKEIVLDIKQDTNIKKNKQNQRLKNNNKELYYKVQLASYRKEKSALNGWDKLSKRYVEQFRNKKPFIEKVDITNKGTFFRLQTGNFLDKKSAQNFCKKLKVINLNCLVIKKAGN